MIKENQIPMLKLDNIKLFFLFHQNSFKIKGFDDSQTLKRSDSK
jgi:hypothetical protein